MTTDLAARVRQLVEGGVEPITLDEVALRAPEKSTSARRTAVVAATLVLVVVLCDSGRLRSGDFDRARDSWDSLAG